MTNFAKLYLRAFFANADAKSSSTGVNSIFCSDFVAKEDAIPVSSLRFIA